MRLLVGALVCLGTLNLLAEGAHANEQPAESNSHQHRVSDGNHSNSTNVDWLSLDKTETAPVTQGSDPHAFDQKNQGPVLLPLPPEAWASLVLLVALAGVRGLKRARII